MDKLFGCIFILCFVLSAGCATTQAEKDNSNQTEYDDLSFQIEPGWKVGHSAEIPNQYSIIEFVREGENVNNWQELLTIQNLLKPWGGPSPEDMLNGLKAVRENECPGVTEWHIIEKNENSILYEWQAKPCLGWPDQHEIAKIIDGKYNRFRVAYTAKVKQLSPDKRAEWIKRLSEIEVRTRLR